MVVILHLFTPDELRVKASRRREAEDSEPSDMDDNGKPLAEEEHGEEGKSSLDWLLLKERPEAVVPMDTNVSMQR